MQYYISKKIENISFDQAIEKTTALLKDEGFGVLTDIDMQSTLKKKLDVDRKPYRILGACNPGFANKALQAEDKVGLMLPCNIIVQELDGTIEVAAIDPVAAMSAIANEDLSDLASEVQTKLANVIDKL